MAATMILSVIFFGIAVLGLALGVILKKRTPLKGECHAPVDGGGTCATCGSGYGEPCGVEDESSDQHSNLVAQKQKAFARGDFTIRKTPDNNRLSR